MNSQKKLDLLIEQALLKLNPNKKFIISEQDPTSYGGFTFTPSTETNTGKTNKPKKLKVKQPKKEPVDSSKTKSSSTEWTPPTKDSTVAEKAFAEKVKKYYDANDPEHDDAWNGTMVYIALAGGAALLLRKGYVRYKSRIDPNYLRSGERWNRSFGKPFWPGWARWFVGQSRRNIEELREFIVIERERGNITVAEAEMLLRELRNAEDFIGASETFNANLNKVKSGKMTMKDLIAELPKAYKRNPVFTNALKAYDNEVLSMYRPGGMRVMRNPRGELAKKAMGYSQTYRELQEFNVDWPAFQEMHGTKYELPSGPKESLKSKVQRSNVLRSAINNGDLIPLTDNALSKIPGEGKILAPDGKLVSRGVEMPAVTVSPTIRNASTLTTTELTINNQLAVKFHLNIEGGTYSVGKAAIRTFLSSERMTTLAGEAYTPREINTIIKNIQDAKNGITLPKSYTTGTVPSMGEWSTDMKNMQLKNRYINADLRKRQIAYAELYKAARR